MKYIVMRLIEKKYQDDIRVIERASFDSLDQALLAEYIGLLKKGKARLAVIPDNEIYELMSIKRNDGITLSSVMNFSPYPQAYFPQLCIIATVIPGKEMGEIGEQGERFLDNQRIEGNISDILCVILMYLEDKEEQAPFLLSELISYVETQLKAYMTIDWTSFTQRKSLVRVLQYMEKLQMIRVRDGRSEGFWCQKPDRKYYMKTPDIRNILPQVFQGIFPDISPGRILKKQISRKSSRIKAWRRSIVFTVSLPSAR